MSDLNKPEKDSSDERILSSNQALVLRLVAIFASVFIIINTSALFLQSLVERGLFLGAMLILCFGYLKFNKNRCQEKIGAIDYIFMLLSLITTLYVVLYNVELLYKFGIPTTTDIILGTIFVIVILEATRRSVGLPLVVISMIAFLYGLLGHLIPGMFGHAGYSFERIIGMLYITPYGIWGFVLAFVVTTLAMFIIFGAFLNVSGAGATFIRFAQVLGSGMVGGPAKVAIIGSSIFGTISGSAVANVVATGTFTIPAMKHAGYPSSFAGAVEAVASSGGQIMPPIMGAGAFIMAEMLGISYLTVMKAALVPAILYYASLWIGVHFGALKYNIPIEAKEKIQSKELLSLLVYFLLPISVLMYYLFKGYSPAMAALFASLVSAATCFFETDQKSFQFSFRKGLLKIVKGLESAGRELMFITVMMASIGIVVGVINMTGIGLVFSNYIIKIGQTSLLLSLFLTMCVCIVLGMGLPTVAAYVVAGIIGAPALIKLGIPALPAHLFIFYYAILSCITPPVCIAVMVASSLAKVNWLKVASDALKLSLPVYIIPYIFVIYPGILLDAPWVQLLDMIVSALFGVLGIAAGMLGYLKLKAFFWERIILVVGGFLLLLPGTTSNIIGAILIVLIYLNQRKQWVGRSQQQNMSV